MTQLMGPPGGGISELGLTKPAERENLKEERERERKRGKERENFKEREKEREREREREIVT